MKTVEFTTDIRPWQRGATAVLPDDVAGRLVASGEAVNPRPFPETAAEDEPPRKSRLTLPQRTPYQTKAAK